MRKSFLALAVATVVWVVDADATRTRAEHPSRIAAASRNDARRRCASTKIHREPGHTHASTRPGTAAKASMVRAKILPDPEQMRTWYPIARRGALGLLAAYVWSLSNNPNEAPPPVAEK